MPAHDIPLIGLPRPYAHHPTGPTGRLTVPPDTD